MALSGQQPKVRVWLDNQNTNELKKFHCSVCGKVVFEYYSDIRILMPGGGEVKVTRAPIVIQCHGVITVVKDGTMISTRCKAKYALE